MQLPIEPIAGESRRVFGEGLLVTPPPRCPTIRAISRPIPQASVARPARDIRTSALRFDLIATHADAHARRRERPAPASLDAAAQAFAFALGDNHRCTFADGDQLNAPGGTTPGTQRNIVEDCAASSRHAYRTPLILRGGSFLASTPGSILESAEAWAPLRITNAAWEGNNARVRGISQRAHGYRNPDNLVLVLYHASWR
jgi:hypothetical protein